MQFFHSFSASLSCLMSKVKQTHHYCVWDWTLKEKKKSACLEDIEIAEGLCSVVWTWKFARAAERERNGSKL